MEKVNTGLDDRVLEESAKILNSVLANSFVLYVKARNFHWNVTGPDFYELHNFFEEIYEELNESVDEIAERVRMLGKRPLSSMQEMLSNADLSENKEQIDTVSMKKELLADYEQSIRQLHEKIESIEELGNHGDEDFLTEVLQTHEKRAWMLRAMIE